MMLVPFISQIAACRWCFARECQKRLGVEVVGLRIEQDRRSCVVVTGTEVVEGVDRALVLQRCGIHVERRQIGDRDGCSDKMSGSVKALHAIHAGRDILPDDLEAAVRQRGDVVRPLRSGLVELVYQDVARVGNDVAVCVIDGGPDALAGAVLVPSRVGPRSRQSRRPPTQPHGGLSQWRCCRRPYAWSSAKRRSCRSRS